MSSNNSSYSWRRDSKRTFSSLIAYTLALVFTLTLMPQQTLAASSTSWSQAGYDNVSKTWTPGNMVKYAEGDYLPYRANAEGYAPTGQDIAFDLDSWKRHRSPALIKPPIGSSVPTCPIPAVRPSIPRHKSRRMHRQPMENLSLNQLLNFWAPPLDQPPMPLVSLLQSNSPPADCQFLPGTQVIRF